MVEEYPRSTKPEDQNPTPIGSSARKIYEKCMQGFLHDDALKLLSHNPPNLNAFL